MFLCTSYTFFFVCVNEKNFHSIFLTYFFNGKYKNTFRTNINLFDFQHFQSGEFHTINILLLLGIFFDVEQFSANSTDFFIRIYIHTVLNICNNFSNETYNESLLSVGGFEQKKVLYRFQRSFLNEISNCSNPANFWGWLVESNTRVEAWPRCQKRFGPRTSPLVQPLSLFCPQNF